MCRDPEERYAAAVPPKIAPFRTVDVSDWEKLSEEPRGKRPKFWVRGAGRQWLRKSPRATRPSEYLATIPEEWLSVARKDFMCRVLERRLTWLGQR